MDKNALLDLHEATWPLKVPLISCSGRESYTGMSEQKVLLFTVDFDLYVVVHVVGSVTIAVESHVLRVGAFSID